MRRAGTGIPTLGDVRRASVLLAVLPLAGSALASAPAGRTFVTTGETGGRFTVVGATIRAGAVVPSSRECDPRLRAVVPRTIALRDGRFSYHGPMKGQSGRIAFSGTLTSRTAAKGRATITRGRCSDTVRWGANVLPGDELQRQSGD
jgi:hypothetical protein